MDYLVHQIFISLLIGCCYRDGAEACHGELMFSGLVGDEKRIILQEHNKLRQSVATGNVLGQPSAENMREIVWDDELAQKAQNWANNCQFRHDPKRTINRFTMGQNLAIIWSTAPLADDDGDFPSRIQAWFNEVRKYSFGDPWAPYTGHYSQLVWGETDLVGCGFSYYKDRSKYNKLYVCNYGPGGNVVGENPYEIGKPSCRNHGLKPSSKYHGLCASDLENDISNSVGVFRNAIPNTFGYRQSNFITKTSFSTTSVVTNVFNNQNNKQGQQVLQQQEQQRPFNLYSAQLTTRTTTTTDSPKLSTTPPAFKQYNKYFFSTISNPAISNSLSETAGADTEVLEVNQDEPQKISWTLSKVQTERPPTTRTTTTIARTTNLNPISTVLPTRRNGWSLFTWRG